MNARSLIHHTGCTLLVALVRTRAATVLLTATLLVAAGTALYLDRGTAPTSGAPLAGQGCPAPLQLVAPGTRTVAAFRALAGCTGQVPVPGGAQSCPAPLIIPSADRSTVVYARPVLC